MLPYIVIILGAYLIGCSNMALYLSRWKGVNLRAGGSKNLGASNAFALMGWKAGLLVAVHDIGKAVLAVELSKWIFPAVPLLFGSFLLGTAFGGYLAGMFCVIGHIFPIFFKFKGGKGFASYLGMILAINWKFALCILAAVVILTVLTDYIVVGTVTSVVSFPIYTAIRSGWLPLVMLVGKTVRLEQHFGIRFARCLGVRRRAIRHGRIKRGGRFRHVVGRQRQCRLVGRWIAFRLHQHIGDGTRTRLRIGRAHQIIGQRSLSGLALPAPHMVFVRSDFAVKQHLGIIGNIGTLRIFGSQQRLPTLQRKISFTDLRTAIARIGACQFIDQLIAFVAGVTFDPSEIHRARAL